jgi:F0F1-type ATP synthase membrane subunit c/vacuolar-type H+-ATPase subunit K
VDKYVKAIVAALMAGLSALGVALADGQVTATEWVVAATAVLGTFAAVWASPANAPKE